MILDRSLLLALSVSTLIGSFIPARAAVTHNLPAGQYMVTAQGGGSESVQSYDDGHFDIVGLFTANGNGGASSLSLTLAYQNYQESSDGFTCTLTNPSDLVYSVNPTGVGTMTLTVSQFDSCVLGDNSGSTSETGKSISFNLYVANGQARIVSTASNFNDPMEAGELIDAPSVAGTVIPSTSVNGAGPVLIEGTGAATDTRTYFGFAHMSVAGYAILSGGSALDLDLTLTYTDDDQSVDAFVCHITNPTDLLTSPSGPVRKLTLTVSKYDSCNATINPYQKISNVGRSITFNYYPASPESKIVSTASTLVDGTGDLISDPGLIATLTPASFNRGWASGTYLLLAQGGGDEPNEDGHLDLAGTVTITGPRAEALNVTLAFQDFNEPADGFTCVLTTASDLTYNPSPSDGAGTLTLTVGPNDTCVAGDNSGPASETGHSITFNLYTPGNQARIASTTSNFISPEEGELIAAPSVSGSFTPAVPAPIAGQSLVEGFGQATDTQGLPQVQDPVNNFAHIGIGGLITLNGAGGATSLDLTLVYTDTNTDTDAMTCRFTSSSDLTYTVTGNVGTMTLTVGPNDTCNNTPKSTPIPNQGHSITFNYYAGYTQSEIVSTASTLVDGNGDMISDVGLTAIIVPLGQ